MLPVENNNYRTFICPARARMSVDRLDTKKPNYLAQIAFKCDTCHTSGCATGQNSDPEAAQQKAKINFAKFFGEVCGGWQALVKRGLVSRSMPLSSLPVDLKDFPPHISFSPEGRRGIGWRLNGDNRLLLFDISPRILPVVTELLKSRGIDITIGSTFDQATSVVLSNMPIKPNQEKNIGIYVSAKKYDDIYPDIEGLLLFLRKSNIFI